MRGEIAWLDLAPFGGITRIRFKGFVYDVSAIRLPRSYIKSRIGAGTVEVNRSEVRGQRSDVRGQRPTLKAFASRHSTSN
jgi:hypothetical protein